MSDFWMDPSSTSILHVCEQQRLWRDCAGSPEPSLVVYVISTIISWAGSNNFQANIHNYLFCFFLVCFYKPIPNDGPSKSQTFLNYEIVFKNKLKQYLLHEQFSVWVNRRSLCIQIHCFILSILTCSEDCLNTCCTRYTGQSIEVPQPFDSTLDGVVSDGNTVFLVHLNVVWGPVRV